jgi:hypothetical protein
MTDIGSIYILNIFPITHSAAEVAVTQDIENFRNNKHRNAKGKRIKDMSISAWSLIHNEKNNCSL